MCSVSCSRVLTFHVAARECMRADKRVMLAVHLDCECVAMAPSCPTLHVLQQAALGQ